ncbi:MAG: hypothetical protein FWH14_07075 [Oscillospiraceae bacterium]|nr:hypothetical protein [Oscillospiraceae bacterium]
MPPQRRGGLPLVPPQRRGGLPLVPPQRRVFFPWCRRSGGVVCRGGNLPPVVITDCTVRTGFVSCGGRYAQGCVPYSCGDIIPLC